MGQIIIQEETMKNPITFIGKQAGIAYGTDITDDAKNYKRGLQCIKDGHGRVLEFADVYMVIKGYSNRVIREFMRHVGDGLTAIQQSTRYVDFSTGFDYVTPHSVLNNDAAYDAYRKVMEDTTDAINLLMNTYKIPKEDAQMLIPLAATTEVTIKKNMRNLTDMSRVRMCNRAYWEFRELMNQLKTELSNYSPEWGTLCSMLLFAKCEKSKICDEKFGCGKYPKKEN